MEGWDGTEEGRGVYESDEALEEIFEVFGPYVRATIRHRVKNGQNPSWALVTMATSPSALSASVPSTTSAVTWPSALSEV